MSYRLGGAANAFQEFNLVNPTPRSMTMRLGCGALYASESSETIRTFTTYTDPAIRPGSAYIVVIAGEGRINVEVRDVSTGKIVAGSGSVALPMPRSNCSAQIRTFDSAIEVTAAGERIISIPLPSTPLVVNSVAWGPNVEGDSFVSVTLDPRNSNKPTPLRGCLLVIGAVCGILSLLPNRITRPRLFRQHQVAGWLNQSTLSVLGVALVVAFAGLPIWDDGYVLARARLVADGWHMSKALIDPYNFGIANVQGFWYESILGLTNLRFSSVIGNRLSTLTLVVLTWLILRKFVLRHVGARRPTAVLVASSVYCYAVLIWGATLRAEILVSFLLAVALAVALAPRLSSDVKFFALATCGLAALAAHQSGLVVVVFAAAAMFSVFNWSNARRQLRGLLAAVPVGILLAFPNQSIASATQEATLYRIDMQGVGVPQYDALDEWIRYTHGFLTTTTLSLWVSLALILVACLVPVQVMMRRRSMPPVAAWLILGSLGLYLTSSKWPWHLSVLTVPSVVAAFAIWTYFGWRSLWIAPAAVVGFGLLTSNGPLISITALLCLGGFAIWYLRARRPPLPSIPKLHFPKMAVVPMSMAVAALALPTFGMQAGIGEFPPTHVDMLKQTLAGLVRPGTPEACAPSFVRQPESWQGRGSVPPNFGALVPCLMPPALASGLWRTPRLNVLEPPSRSQSWFPAPLSPCTVTSSFKLCVNEWIKDD